MQMSRMQQVFLQYSSNPPPFIFQNLLRGIKVDGVETVISSAQDIS